MSELAEKIIKKKFECCNSDADDFKTEDELTVTITLHEYRELVKAKAVSDSELSAARDKNWKLHRELDKANETIKKLKEKIIQLTTGGVEESDKLGIEIMEEEEGDA